ncbi:cytochrome c oxidase subunit 2A [Oceanobacillus halotolerans]|nr:cytochrome c oxidase subunit 2A [Oceanobacillus halotolerans]
MSNLQEKKTDPNQKKEPELKGTLISVFLVGAFIVISWIGVFVLFISR